MKQNLNEATVTVLPVFNTHYRMIHSPGQQNKMPHMTIPDMTMPLVELIDRFASGAPVSVGQALYYDGKGHQTEIEDDVLLGVKWESLDIVEKHAILNDAKRDFSRINEGVKKAQKEKADKLAEERKARDLKEKEFDEFIKNQKKAE